MSRNKNNRKSKKVFKQETHYLPGTISEENCIGVIKLIKKNHGFIEREQGKLPDAYSNLICPSMKVGDVVKFDMVINENNREIVIDLICFSEENIPA